MSPISRKTRIRGLSKLKF
uniref:Uncharacterized protein n=1 Tax=Lepeophtheirus salmonis TaxID=72036 RepID=A0A0K2TT16_LEPSM